MSENLTRGYGLLESFLAKKRAKMADELIPKKLRNGKILDVGCGTVPFFLINTIFKEKYGIDPSVRLNEFKGIELRKIGVEKENIPFADNFFDVVTMLSVFEHIEPDKLVGVLKEIKRVLKPRGRFILTTPCPWADKILRVMAKLRLVSKEEVAEHNNIYHRYQIASYLAGAGFKRRKMRFGYFEFFMNRLGIC